MDTSHIVLLAVLLALLALLLIPFRLAVRYGQEGFQAWAAALFFRYQLFPRPKKDKKKKFSHLLLTGLAFVVLAVFFLILFYKV